MLDGVRTAINTVTFATPLLGGIALLVGTTPARGAGAITLAIGGAMAGAIVAGIWEATVNSADRWEIKTETVMGSAAIGAVAGVAGPMLFGR